MASCFAQSKSQSSCKGLQGPVKSVAALPYSLLPPHVLFPLCPSHPGLAAVCQTHPSGSQPGTLRTYPEDSSVRYNTGSSKGLCSNAREPMLCKKVPCLPLPSSASPIPSHSLCSTCNKHFGPSAVLFNTYLLDYCLS